MAKAEVNGLGTRQEAVASEERQVARRNSSCLPTLLTTTFMGRQSWQSRRERGSAGSGVCRREDRAPLSPALH